MTARTVWSGCGCLTRSSSAAALQQRYVLMSHRISDVAYNCYCVVPGFQTGRQYAPTTAVHDHGPYREGDPKGWSTVLVTALGSGGNRSPTTLHMAYPRSDVPKTASPRFRKKSIIWGCPERPKRDAVNRRLPHKVVFCEFCTSPTLSFRRPGQHRRTEQTRAAEHGEAVQKRCAKRNAASYQANWRGVIVPSKTHSTIGAVTPDRAVGEKRNRRFESPPRRSRRYVRVG